MKSKKKDIDVERFLVGKKTITLPMLQKALGLSYLDARNTIEALEKNDLISYDGGIEYRVVREDEDENNDAFVSFDDSEFDALDDNGETLDDFFNDIFNIDKKPETSSENKGSKSANDDAEWFKRLNFGDDSDLPSAPIRRGAPAGLRAAAEDEDLDLPPELRKQYKTGCETEELFQYERERSWRVYWVKRLLMRSDYDMLNWHTSTVLHSPRAALKADEAKAIATVIRDQWPHCEHFFRVSYYEHILYIDVRHKNNSKVPVILEFRRTEDGFYITDRGRALEDVIKIIVSDKCSDDDKHLLMTKIAKQKLFVWHNAELACPLKGIDDAVQALKRYRSILNAIHTMLQSCAE